ncbi:hypothetical protein [Embleya sp. NBC_00888]|uniref:hypothetical protein n=1 Tax=Embleya sp. NBC_00888 TaxID=2975960 RepID=UPI0038636A76
MPAVEDAPTPAGGTRAPGGTGDPAHARPALHRRDQRRDLESLAYRAAGCAGRIVAIEAIWDGDTVHDYFVRLPAITADPEGEAHMATVYRSTAGRYLGEDAGHHPRHPAAVAAERAGGTLAAHLSVPFHFAGPDTPDDEASRRRS